MSLTELNNNTTFDHFPNEIRVNRSINVPNKYNMTTFSNTRKTPIIYGRGVDDYVTNEIKKAKYQGCFDPGSLGNKNIFNDNTNLNIEKNINLKTKLNNQNKVLDQNYRYSNFTSSSSRIQKYDEGKDLLIAKFSTNGKDKKEKYFLEKENIKNQNNKEKIIKIII